MKEKIFKKGTVRRLFSVVLALALVCSLISAMSLTVLATESGEIGGLSWNLADDGTLTVSGNGVMLDKKLSEYPWNTSRDSITSIVIASGVTSIGEEAFRECRNAATVSIPDTVSSIGDGAFRSCVKLESVKIPYGVKEIGENTFYSCTNLTNVTIPESVQKIGDSAFGSCVSITSITIPKSVTAIDGLAFAFCGSLESVVMSSVNPPTAGGDIFEGCDKLKIYVPSGSVQAYKTATNWITYENKIVGHDHSFTYSASGAVLTATCQNQGCGLTGGKVSLTLTASDANYSGSAYTGAALSGTADWDKAGLNLPNIKYVGREGTKYEETPEAPIDEGKYTAKITPDSKVFAQVDFEITSNSGTPNKKDKVKISSKENYAKGSLASTPNELYSALEKYLSSDVIDAINDGIILNVWTEVEEKKESSLDSKDKQKIAEKLPASYNVGKYLDINLKMMLMREDGSPFDEDTEITVTKTNEKVKLKITVPEELRKAGRTYNIIRLHDGEATVLGATLSEGYELTFETDSFSTYALIYTDAAPASTVTSAKTGESVPFALIMLTISMFGVVLFTRKRV